jgi:hemoglobin-like flavoprotein
MTPAQIESVRKSFATVVLNLDQITAAFCRRLAALAPGLGALFGGDPVVQRIKIGAALAGMVGSLGQLDRIRPALEALGRERSRQGVDADDYAIVGQALISGLEQVLGDAFDTQTRRAWIAAYGELAWIMIRGAEQDRIEARAA